MTSPDKKAIERLRFGATIRKFVEGAMPAKAYAANGREDTRPTELVLLEEVSLGKDLPRRWPRRQEPFLLFFATPRVNSAG